MLKRRYARCCYLFPDNQINGNQAGAIGASSSGHVTSSVDSTDSAQSSSSSERHRSAVDWKFSELDVGDVDGQLDRKELRTLRYLVNKLVKPRPCARTFVARCDVNSDRRLSRREWITCFDVADGGSADGGLNEEEPEVDGGWCEISTRSS